MMQADDISILFKPDGHLSDHAVALYAEALHYSGPDLLPPAVVSHVEDCLDCKAAIMDVVELIQPQDLPAIVDHPYFGKAQKSGNAEPPAGKPARSGRGGYMFLRIAAGLLIVSAISMLLMVVIKNISPQKTPLSRQDTAGNIPEQQMPDTATRILKQNPPEAPLLAESFTANPALDKLISGQTRAWNAKLISPRSEARYTVGKAILFQWEYPDTAGFRLRILNNAGKLQLEQETKSSSLKISSLEKNGLYYWFLSADDDMIGGGKFTIGNPEP